MSQLQLSIIIPAEDAEDLQLQLVDHKIVATRSESEGFDGKALVELLVPLSSVAIPALVALYKARVAANRYISYKCQEFEVKGVSDATLTKLIELGERRRSAN